MADRDPGLRNDQADGLRRFAPALLPALCTMLSADDPCNKHQFLHRLAQRKASHSQQVLIIHSRISPENSQPALMDVVRGHASLEEVVRAGRPGVQCAPLGRVDSDEAPGQLMSLLRQLIAHQFHLLVDAELDTRVDIQLDEANKAGFEMVSALPLPLLTEGELVLQVPAEPAAICRAYDIMRALKPLCITRMLSLLVTGDNAAHVSHAQANLFHAARRYLAMPVRAIVPPAAA